jgi:hypothetical protein
MVKALSSQDSGYEGQGKQVTRYLVSIDGLFPLLFNRNGSAYRAALCGVGWMIMVSISNTPSSLSICTPSLMSITKE